MKKIVFCVAAAVAALSAGSAQAAVTYEFTGFSDVVGAAQSTTFSVANYLSGNATIALADMTACASGDGSDCVDIAFAENDPYNGFTDQSLFNFETSSSGTFYYFAKTAFKANGVYASTIGFNAATLTVSGIPGAVPEPASWALMIGGLVLAGGLIRRAARAQTARVNFA